MSPASSRSMSGESLMLIGRGRLQLRQSGKHLVLMAGFKDSAVRFKADKFVDKEIEVYVKMSGDEPRVKRRSVPRIKYL